MNRLQKLQKSIRDEAPTRGLAPIDQKIAFNEKVDIYWIPSI